MKHVLSSILKYFIFLFSSFWGELGGSGSIMSTANDMTKWLQLQLNKGKDSCGKKIVEADVMEDTHSPVVPIKINSFDEYWRKPYLPVTYDHHQYGLGWRIGHYRGKIWTL